MKQKKTFQHLSKKYCFGLSSKIKSVKRKLRENIPTVASSLEWQHYHIRKEETKELQEKAKEERKQKRIKKVKSKPEPTKTSKQELKSDSIVEVGEYCIVNYNGSEFPGEVLVKN